ncbi:MAG TPA: tetratricopeptide repeat protein [Xanthobacteraceae bacterium]|nr:tetratricopeptide repeat protein [Xanthobacteraceae bacterium]
MERRNRGQSQEQGSREQNSRQQSSRNAPGRPSPAAGLFAKALAHFRAGDLQNAERAARELLSIDHSNADAYHLMGMIGFQLGRFDAARQLLKTALTLDSRNADCHVNMAQVLRALGSLDDATTHLVQATTLNRNHSAARVALGDVYMQQGRLGDAQARYERAATLDPNLVGAHYGLGNVAIQQGRMDDAVAHYRRVLALNPNFAEAYSNIGVALASLGDLKEAADHYQRAVALKPGLIDVYRNLIRLLMTQGELNRALEVARRALAIQETDEIKILLLQCIKLLPRDAWPAGLPDWIARALQEGWTRPSELSALAAELIRTNELINGCIKRAVTAWPLLLPAAELWGEQGFAAVVGDRLLGALLASAPIRDLDLERFITMARSAVLETIAAPDATPPVETLGFACSLARQCFINEYVLAETAAEAETIANLQTSIEKAIEASRPVSPLQVAAVAAYRPLRILPLAEKILRRPWPGPVEAVVDRQLRDPQHERNLRSTITVLTSIEDSVSQEVRRQYEEMPYPRWLKAALIGKPVNIEWYLHNQFPGAPIQDAGRHGPLDVLIAGCGTGQHAIETARRFAGAKVTAIDLSLASLSYATRMTNELGLTNVHYAQADILKLGELEQRFDLIESSGVLHHLGDWADGWRVLVSLLRPGGFMHIGLYSAVARADIRTARAYIAEHGYGSTVEDIRRCRQDILAQEDGAPLKNVAKFTDFFSTSECRDLLFHVQEHPLTLPEIKAFLEKHDLTFIGFAGIDTQEFRKRNPNDGSLRNLDLWHAFEIENPTTFVGMYQFWVQKPAAAAPD